MFALGLAGLASPGELWVGAWIEPLVRAESSFAKLRPERQTALPFGPEVGGGRLVRKEAAKIRRRCQNCALNGRRKKGSVEAFK